MSDWDDELNQHVEGHSRDISPPLDSLLKNHNACHLPVSEPAHAFCQIAPCLKLRIDDRADIDFGERMADKSSKMLWESPEGIVASLSSASIYCIGFKYLQ